jgi:zinc protease
MMTVLSGLVWQTEDLLIRATRYAEADRVTGDARNATERLRRVSDIEIDSLRNYVAAYLTRARARIAVVTPRKEELRALGTGLDPASLPRRADESGVAGAPPVVPLPSPAGARRFRLANGLEVVLWPRPGFPAVTAALLFRGGRAVANPPGAESFLDEVLPLRFCGGLPSFRGIGISTNVLPDGVLELAHGGAQNLSAVLLSLAERAAAYRYDQWSVLARLQKETCGMLSPEEERARLWTDVLAQGKRRLEQRNLELGRSAGPRALRALVRALLGGTAYEPPPPAALEAITAAELEAWHLSSRRPENAILLVVGKVDPVEGEQLVRGWFSSWRPEAASRPARTSSPAVGAAPPRLFRVTEVGVDQAQVVLGCRLSSGSIAESAAAQVLARLLARDLRLRLREQLGATYGVHADLLELKLGATLMTVQTDVARAHLAGALKEIVARLEGVAAQPPGAAPLRRAQLEVFRQLAGPVSTDQLASQATRLLLLGQPLEQLDSASAAAAQVSGAAVSATAALCRRTLSVAVAGDAAALAPLSLPGFALEDLR